MKRYFIPFALLCATLTFASCGDNEDNDIDVPTEEVVPGTNHNLLVAYFSEPLPDGVDASTSASRVIVNGDLYGSVEYMATVISETTGADIVRIQTATPYPGNFDDLASQADNERQNDIHPALATDIENFDDYDVIFVGYPIWWYDAAWPVEGFVTENDFTGKTVIPFCTSSSSGLGESGELLAELAGTGNWLEGRRFTERASQSDIQNWVNSLELNTDATTNNDAPASQESRVLVTYFSMPETTNPNNMTTEEDNSVVVIDGEVLGNTQYMAYVIQETTGADIFRIEPRTPYPTNHSTLVDLAAEEQEQNARPAIKDRVTNMDDYDVVFIGYPIWWSDMPQILYTFFDTYDFSGKTIIPFSTHGGSSFAGTPRTIQRLEPDATMLDGLTISRNNIQDARQEIIDWVNDLDI